MRFLPLLIALIVAPVFAVDQPTPTPPEPFETLCENLAAARCKVADLSLRRINPFISDEVRAQLAGERDAAVQDVAKYRLEYGILVQTRVAHFEKRHEEVPDEVKYPAKAYEAMFALKNAIVLSAVVDVATVKTAATDAISSDTFCAKMLEAAQGDGNEAYARAQKLVVELRPKLRVGSEETASLLTRVASLIPSFLSTTGDQETAEEILTMALGVDPSVPSLWALRAKTRMAQGRSEESLADVVVALSLNSEDKEAQAAYKRYGEIPAKVDVVYLEGCTEVDSTGALMALTFGRDCWPNEERGALAFYRNYCRRLYACSFNGDTEIRAKAIKFAIEEGKDAVKLRPNALKPAIDAFASKLNAGGNTGRKLMELFDEAAPLMAGNPTFWEYRARLLLGVDHTRAAAAAIDVGAALDPEGTWVPELRKMLAEAEKAEKAG